MVFALFGAAAGYAVPAAHGVAVQPQAFLKPQESPHPKPVSVPLVADNFQLGSPLMIYGTVLCFVAGLIVVIFKNHGWTTILSVLAYIGALSTMTIQLRELFAVQMYPPKLLTHSQLD